MKNSPDSPGEMDQFTRKARLTTFHHALAADETQQVEQEIQGNRVSYRVTRR